MGAPQSAMDIVKLSSNEHPGIHADYPPDDERASGLDEEDRHVEDARYRGLIPYPSGGNVSPSRAIYHC